MKLAVFAALLSFLSSVPSVSAADTAKPWKPCTVRSPTTDRFFDLNPMRRSPPEEGKKKKEGEEGSWKARGHDYGANFTLNFCGPVVEELQHVQDLDKSLWKNVSAYYEKDDKIYAIGLEAYEPIFRGRKLVLNYTHGSRCPTNSKSHTDLLSPVSLSNREIVQDDEYEAEERGGNDEYKAEAKDDDDDEDDEKPKKKPLDSARRKTTIISLLCEKDGLAKTSVSFVAAVDDCVYFFEGRSPYACGGVEAETQALSPGGVFGVIVGIAVLVYLVGGCVYQRTVMHQRGWRQLPNYSMWAGIASFGRDLFIILTSSCARLLPSRRGYSRISLGQDNGRRGRNSDDENRLIDNLDEEWDD